MFLKLKSQIVRNKNLKKPVSLLKYFKFYRPKWKTFSKSLSKVIFDFIDQKSRNIYSLIEYI